MRKLALLAVLAAASVASPAHATLTTAANSVSYTGNGVTTAYVTNFKFLKNADLSVTVAGVPTSAYTATGAGNPTGTVTFTVAPANGAAIVITRTVDYLQSTSLRGTRNFTSSAVETAIDKLAMQNQQLASVLPTTVSLSFRDEGNVLGPISSLNCVGAGITCSIAAGAGTLTTVAVNPMLDVQQNNTQSFTSGAVTIVIWNVANRDTDAAYSAGTGRYTIPAGKGGDYSVSSCVTFTGNPSLGSTTDIHIFKNAVQVRSTTLQNATASGSLCVSATMNYAAGDIVDIRVRQSSGGALTLTSTPAFNFFSLKRVSD